MGLGRGGVEGRVWDLPAGPLVTAPGLLLMSCVCFRLLLQYMRRPRDNTAHPPNLLAWGLSWIVSSLMLLLEQVGRGGHLL